MHEATRLNQKLLSDLKKLAQFQRIKNSDNLSKEDLLYTLLRSEKNHLEDNYMKNIQTMTKKAKINIIRILAPKLSNSLAKEERNVIRKELYAIENKKRFTKTQRQKAYAYLIKSLNTLDNKEKY